MQAIYKHMHLPYSYNAILIQPDDSPVTTSIPCADCGANILTAFGYANVASTSAEPKPTVYFADWVPQHVERGITLLVGRGEFQGDEAVNLCAIAFSLKPYKDGLNIELVDAGQTLFAEGLRHVFSEMSTVSEAMNHPELELYHSIALRVVGDEPRFKPLLKNFASMTS
jgi:hypothetical protein